MSGAAGDLWQMLERSARDGGGGLVLIDGRGREERRSWADLAALAARRAAGLTRAGAERGERVLLVLPNGEEFLACLFGALRAGVLPCAISPPQGFGTRAAFARRLGEVAATLGARRAVCLPGQAEAVAAALPPGVSCWTPADIDAGPAPGPALRGEDPAFLQLTSGSTGRSKGVVLEHRAVLANVEQIAAATGVTADTRCVVWLPLFHDMGLIGGSLGCLARGGTLILSTPYRFLRRPLHWLEAISRHGGTHSPAPTFAYRHVLERLGERATPDLDLRSWRAAYVGAEPIDPSALRAFEDRFAPCGLSPRALLPCYGMAEASLAVSACPLDEPWRARAVSRAALAAEGRVAEPADAADAREVVSCGPPLAGTEVRVVGADGEALGPGREGEVEVRGPSLLRGYWGEPPRAPGSWFASGDWGFLAAGELHLTGRKKELMILRGENHHPAEVEWAAAQVAGVRRAAAFGLADARLGTERLCLVVEVERGRSTNGGDGELDVAVRRRVQDLTGLTVSELRRVPKGTLPLTTSGKLQRARARELLEG